jgi:hypothetical protein
MDEGGGGIDLADDDRAERVASNSTTQVTTAAGTAASGLISPASVALPMTPSATTVFRAFMNASSSLREPRNIGARAVLRFRSCPNEPGHIRHRYSGVRSSPFWIAYRISSYRLCRCSFERMFWTWFCTVFTLMKSFSAISR